MATTDISYDTPAMRPPGNAEPNFNNPPSLHALTVGLGVVCMTVMTVSVGIRTFTKVVILRDVKHEDYLAVFALVGFLIFDIIYIWLSSRGFTRDQWNIRAVDLNYMMWIFSFIPILYSLGMGSAKYFVCVQLRRIFCPGATSSRGTIWWSLQILITANILYYIASFFTFVFQCVPREKVRYPEMDGVCINYNASFMAAGVINLILDIGILAVPVFAIWQLQMPFKRKLGTVSIFAVGILTCIVAALGVAFRVPLLTEENVTRATANIGFVTFIEFTGTLLVGCMPMFPRFYSWLRAKDPASNHQSSGDAPASIRANETGFNNRRGTMPREAIRKTPEYIELRDGDIESRNWKPLNDK